MSPEKQQILIDYVDGQLRGEELQAAERLISENAEAAQELDVIRFSVDLVREAAINDQAAAARHAYASNTMQAVSEPKQSPAVVRSFSSSAMRIAAAVLVLLVSITIFKYANTNRLSVYDDNFTSFELSTSRGNNHDGPLEDAYRNKNWTAVEKLAAAAPSDIKSSFLAGMADMETKKFDKAITHFTWVLHLNTQAAEPYFRDEAEYYLALSYLAADQPAAGNALIRKIKAEKNHLFYKKASAISGLDMKVLEMKQ